jgi:hypothetical protein
VRPAAAAVRRCLRLLVRHVRFAHPLAPAARVAARHQALTELFRTVNHYLRDLGVEHWIVDGTLLGYHRQGDILAHDKDVDFGAHEREYDAIRSAGHRLPSGYRLYDTSHRHRGPKLYIAHQGWEADIYFYEDRGGQLRSYANEPTAGYAEPFPRGFVYPIAQAQFLGQPTCVPAQVVAYLHHAYGYIGADAVQDRATGYWRRRTPTHD